VDDEVVLVAHGGGGLMTRQLLREICLPILANPLLEPLDDAACLALDGLELAMTTDSYVVDPIFFPGGDIGKLAACGTINDLAMQGAEPRFLSLGLILEEGLPLGDLRRAIRSIAEVADSVGVRVVTGDTKVVEHGKGGGIYINTTGLGVRRAGIDVHVSRARPGDAVIVTGMLGDHGIAVMSCREGLEFDSPIESDVAPLWGLVRPLLDAVPQVHCLRDPTRGGLAAALCDIAEASNTCIRVRETALPVRRAVRSACDFLGLDPLNVACEGRAVVICSGAEADRALRLLRSHPLGADAAIIGGVVSAPAGMVIVETTIGGERIVTLPAGEELPRIC